MVRRALVGLAVAVLWTGCEGPRVTAGPEPARGAAPGPALDARMPPAAAPVPACPPDMAVVEGLFCPAADERCEAHHPEYVADSEKSERCLRFTEPSECLSDKRVLLRFCIDKYEWPNQSGELPRVLVDWGEAEKSCESVGKRLCEETEWLFSCEGENMLPYVTGYERDPTACAIDRPYVERPRRLERWDACMASPSCRRDFEKVDQREPSGALARCVSPFGVYDMNGNVNEWVRVKDETYPHRSALKGGWWGPVRDRCRPTVRFHDESDWGYEIGFRCCRDAMP